LVQDTQPLPSRLNEAVQNAGKILKSVSKASITDSKGKKAWKECTALLGQMQPTIKQFFEPAEAIPGEKPGPKSILKDSKSAAPAVKNQAENSRVASGAASVVSSVGTAVTAHTSPESDEEEGSDGPSLFNYNGQVVTRSAMELLEEEADMIERGLYERDGVIMTASALSLLQAQEAMGKVDSAGHGEWGRRLPSVMEEDDEHDLVVLDV
jgi:hypothetical protein